MNVCWVRQVKKEDGLMVGGRLLVKIGLGTWGKDSVLPWADVG